MTKPNPCHPGLIIEDVLTAFKITPACLAMALKVSPSTVSRIISGKMRLSANLALRVQKTLGISARLLLDMQSAYDLRQAEINVEETGLLLSLPTLVENVPLKLNNFSVDDEINQFCEDLISSVRQMKQGKIERKTVFSLPAETLKKMDSSKEDLAK